MNAIWCDYILLFTYFNPVFTRWKIVCIPKIQWSRTNLLWSTCQILHVNVDRAQHSIWKLMNLIWIWKYDNWIFTNFLPFPRFLANFYSLNNYSTDHMQGKKQCSLYHYYLLVFCIDCLHFLIIDFFIHLKTLLQLNEQ